jgi:uncharacterized protein (TIGR02687 family)
LDLKSIQEKLNNEFKGLERKLVFWYDENAEFADEVDTIELENARIYKLTTDNWFYTKYFFETIDKTTNYLIYAPFPKPSDRDNHLSDTIYYSRLFYADKISLVMHDLKIPDRLKEHMNRYSKFWNSNERINNFAGLCIENYNEEALDIGILSVLCSVKTPNFDEIVKTLIISGEFENNKHIAAFEKMGILTVFWQLCQKYHGYNDEKPTLEKLVITLLITYTAHCFKGELPKAWLPFISTKKNDIVVFISNFMNNMLYRDKFISLADKISRKIKVKDYMATLDIDCFIACDTFSGFDDLIIDKLISWFKEEAKSSQGLLAKIKTIVNNRLQMYYADIFKNEYKSLESALRIISIPKLPKPNDDIVDRYVKELYSIDTAYRKFYITYDKLSDNHKFDEIRQLVENFYSNAFLAKLSASWSEKLTGYKSYQELPQTRQWEFYDKYVVQAVKKETTVVIISDALRYDCALELQSILNDSVKYSAELDYMISCLPSYTKLGMAATLPHKQITYTDNYEVLVDGLPVASTEQRQKVLENYNKNAVAFAYSDIISFGREEIRKQVSGKELIYIYHNQIDARGDNASTENEVFEAVEESFQEIIKVINKLTTDRSITKYIITADHGFIYKRDKLDESDKITQNSEYKMQNVFKNKRFMLSRESLNIDGSIDFTLGYLGNENNDIHVTVPRAEKLFKASGGGQNYVHGGASLQEMIVPVIKLKSARAKKETSQVEVILISLSRKITNLITYLDFMQKDNVSDTLLPVVMKIYFINEAGEKISNDNIIYADKKSEPPEKRMFKEKFTFRNRKYSKSEKYFLVMIDDKTEVELGRFEFTIDMAFTDDFGF